MEAHSGSLAELSPCADMPVIAIPVDPQRSCHTLPRMTVEAVRMGGEKCQIRRNHIRASHQA